RAAGRGTSEAGQRPPTGRAVRAGENPLALPPKPEPEPVPTPPQPVEPPPPEKTPPPEPEPVKPDPTPAPQPKAEPVRKVATGASPPSRPAQASQGAQVDVLPRQLATNLAPPYPPDALAAGHQGLVELLVRTDTLGRATHVSLYRSSGVASLDQSALTTVRRWLFEPARRGGRPVPFEVLVPVRFYIRQPF